LVSLRENAKDDGAIIDAVDRLSKRLRERIGESLKTIRASDPLEQVTTGSLAALRKYSQALRANDAGETDRAVALLGEAIALDTTFAMAYRKLAVVLNNTGQAPSRIADAATSAFRHRDRLTPLERDLADAFYYYQADFDRAKVESGYRSALELDPENYMALNNLALALNTQRKFAQAESLTQRGVAVSPTQATLYVNAMQAQIGQGNYAATSFAESRGQLGAYVAGSVWLAMINVRGRNAPETALRQVEEALRRHPLASLRATDRPYPSLAWFYAQAGRPERARQLLAEYAIQVPEAFRLREPFRHGAAAAVALAEGRVQDAVKEYRSEEHTSELQSRFDLVCRLLLEKK